MFKKPITYFSILAVVIGSIFFINGLILAWSPPTQSPPDGNVPAPLNVGSTNQTKSAGLRLNGDTFGLYGRGTSYGVFGRDFDSVNSYGYLGYSNWGGYFRGDTGGVYAVDNDTGAAGRIGHSYYGVYSIGSGNHGLYSRDEDGSSWTHLNLSEYGLYSNTKLRAPILYDHNDTNYYVDPAGTSKLKTVNLGNVSKSAWPSLQCVTITTPGNGATHAYCPNGYTLTGGGCWWNEGDQYRFSMPSGNSWYCDAWDWMEPVTAYARCCKVD